MSEKKDILSLSLAELTEFVSAPEPDGLGEPKFRAKQIYAWLTKGCGIAEMSDLSKKLREKLELRTEVRLPKIADKLTSKLDGTVKYLFELADGEYIESVVMKYEHGYSICVSSQAGCRMGCRFCASTIAGYKRSLLPSEILGQVIAAQRNMRETLKNPELRISNIVMMGIGEPLDNFDNAIKFLELVNSPDGLNIGYRHISLSTCGLCDKIYKLAELELPITLSISLHAATDEERSSLMPVNNKYGIAELLSACKAYYDRTGRRISFEYALIAGKNDRPEDAEQLANVLIKYLTHDIPFHVNLIPVNEVKERDFKATSRDSAKNFAALLGRRGIEATVRRKLGADINAACGQLRSSRGNG